MTIKEMQARFTGEWILVADPQTNEALEVYFSFQLFSFSAFAPVIRGFPVASALPITKVLRLLRLFAAILLSLCVRFTRFLPFQR